MRPTWLDGIDTGPDLACDTRDGFCDICDQFRCVEPRHSRDCRSGEDARAGKGAVPYSGFVSDSAVGCGAYLRSTVKVMSPDTQAMYSFSFTLRK